LHTSVLNVGVLRKPEYPISVCELSHVTASFSSNRTRSVCCEKPAWEKSCCKSVRHTYKFLVRVNPQEFLKFLVRLSWA